MKRKKAEPLHKVLYVIMEDVNEDNEKIPVAFLRPEDIPEDQHGESIGVYQLSAIRKFAVRKELE